MAKIVWKLAILLFAITLMACEEFVPREDGRHISSIDENTGTNGGDILNNDDISHDDNDDEITDDPMIWPEFDWSHKHADFLEWNQQTFDSIEEVGENLITKRPRDILSFCPSYDQLNVTGKKLFWVSLLAAMARFESSFKPETSFVESFTDSSGQNVVSRGLLQLSIESALAYKCPLANANELHRPDKNLGCAVRIMDRWIDRDGVITAKESGKWRGGARYWSVLRKPSTLKSIRTKTASNEVCQ